MAIDTWTASTSGSWTTAGDWSNGVPISTSDVVIGSSGNNTTVTSAANATVNTIQINTGDELDVTNGSTFTDTSASSASGTFGAIQLDTASFIIDGGVFNNSGNFIFNSTTSSQTIVAINGSVTFDGAGAILLGVSGTAGAGSNIIESQSGIATLTDVDNEIGGSGSILSINFINETVVETDLDGTLILWGDAGGGAFNNENLVRVDLGGTLILGNGADNTVNIANTGAIELDDTTSGFTTKMEITDNVIINGSGGGQIEFTGANSGNGNEIVSDGTDTAVSLTLNGGELTGAGSIGDSFLTLKLQSFLIEETSVQLVDAAVSTSIDSGSKIEAANGGEIFLYDPVTNNGIINVLTGGEIFLTGSITNQGNGSIFIGPGGTLSVSSTATINGIVQFTGAGATLALGADHRISNSIAGAAAGDNFDLTYETYNSGFSVVWLQASGGGTLQLELNGVVQTTVSLAGNYTAADFAVAEDVNGNTLIQVIGNQTTPPTPPPGGTTALMVMNNASNGEYEIYDVGGNAILAAYPLGQVGSLYKFAAMGTFQAGDTSDMLLRNTSTGAFEAYYISNNSITGAVNAGTVGTDWNFAGTGNFDGGSSLSELLLRNSTSGAFELYHIAGGGVLAGSAVGPVGNNFQVKGFGNFSESGTSQMIMQDTSGDASNGQIELYTYQPSTASFAGIDVGKVGSNLTILGMADLLGNGSTQMVMQQNNGDIWLYSYNAGTNTLSGTEVGAIGSNFHVVGFGPLGTAGQDEMLMQNAAGAFEAYQYSASENAFVGTSMGAVGAPWVVDGIAADPPSGSSASTAQLIQAMASIGGGAPVATASGPTAGAELSQPTLLTTPHPA